MCHISNLPIAAGQLFQELAGLCVSKKMLSSAGLKWHAGTNDHKLVRICNPESALVVSALAASPSTALLCRVHR